MKEVGFVLVHRCLEQMYGDCGPMWHYMGKVDFGETLPLLVRTLHARDNPLAKVPLLGSDPL